MFPGRRLSSTDSAAAITALPHPLRQDFRAKTTGLRAGRIPMKSRLNLKQGQKGTKKLVEQYGRSLLYVRYLYDEARVEK